jgi:hypothetical protein
MTCKHLTITSKRHAPMEGANPSSSQGPQGWPVCSLGRQPFQEFLFAQTTCEETPEEGPCWWWAKVYPSQPDTAF